jgi:hypothetical protein
VTNDRYAAMQENNITTTPGPKQIITQHRSLSLSLNVLQKLQLQMLILNLFGCDCEPVPGRFPPTRNLAGGGSALDSPARTS